MKAFLTALATLALLPAAALAVETEGEGVNVRHLKNVPHTDSPNETETESNAGTDLEFATITVSPGDAPAEHPVPAAGVKPSLETTPAAEKKARKCQRFKKRTMRKGASKQARKKALRKWRKCKAANRRARARTADADPTTPGKQRTFAFVGSYYDGVDIVDVTDRANPEVVSHYDCGIAQGDVQVFQRDGGWFMAYSDDQYDVYKSQCIDDIPRELGAEWEDGDYGEDGGGMYIVDVSNPYAPKTVSFVPVPLGSHNLTVHPSGNYVYNSNSELITSFQPAIEIIDISNLAAPKVVEEFELQTFPGLGTESHDITFSESGHRAYVAALSHAEILDTTDPAAPVRKGTVLDPAINVWHQSGEITVGDKSYLIVEDEFAGATDTGQCPNGAVHVYDITDEANATKVGAFQIDEVRPTGGPDPTSGEVGRCTAHVFEIHPEEQLMLIGWYNAGARVLDLSELEGYTVGEESTGGIKQLGYFQFTDTDVWAAKAPDVSRDGFVFYANDHRRGLDAYEYKPGAEAPAGRWLTPEEALAGANRLREASPGLRKRGICFLKTG